MALALHARYPGMHELIESVIDAITEQIGDARVAGGSFERELLQEGALRLTEVEVH